MNVHFLAYFVFWDVLESQIVGICGPCPREVLTLYSCFSEQQSWVWVFFVVWRNGILGTDAKIYRLEVMWIEAIVLGNLEEHEHN